MAINFNNPSTWLKPLIPVAYGVSGWIITEIPILVKLVPSTIDGFSTSGLVAGLAFVASGAYWLHNYLAPYLQPAPSPSPIPTPTPTPTPTPIPGFSLDSNMKAPTIGSSFILSIANGTPNGTVNILEVENMQPVTVPITLDANGNGSLSITNMTTLSPIGLLIDSQGSIDLVGKDVTSGKTTNQITLT